MYELLDSTAVSFAEQIFQPRLTQLNASPFHSAQMPVQPRDPTLGPDSPTARTSGEDPAPETWTTIAPAAGSRVAVPKTGGDHA
jgi:hypothetical protein